MWFCIQAAEAAPAFDSTSTCAPVEVLGTLPKDGDVGVPADVMPVVVHNNGCGSVPTPRLLDGIGEVPVTLLQPSDTVVRLVPDAPLTVGETYTIDVPDTGEQFTFTVGDTPPPVPGPAELAGAFDVLCEGITTLSMDLTLSFADADPAQRGLVWIVTTVDGGNEDTAGPYVYDGQPTLDLATTVLGGRQLCASVLFEELSGATAWQTEELCGEEFVCPSEDEEADSGGGCGCRTGSPAAGLALLPLLLRRRAQRRR